MAYIVVLNPLILNAGVDAAGAKLPITALAAGTALVAGVMTILMGVVARFPLALAAGLGVNALVAYEIAPQMTWADAMGLVVIEGVVIAILVLTGLRTLVFRAVPTQLKTAIGVGIGMFAEGARTGVANLVTGGLFLLAMFLAPLVVIVPFEAASTALVVVGFLMLTAVRQIDWTDYAIAVPAFLTITLMPFTYSISNGIGAGVISYVVLKLVVGRGREVHPILYGVAVLFLLYFLRGPLESALL
jgi:xanthine/uracil/vitamin C permease (AzgA family)